jgi:putative ABC transport system permease protein
VFGLAPALHAIRTSQRGALQEGGRGIAGDTRGRLRGMLVVAQLCLALVLLVGTALSIRSFARIQQVAPGFDAGAALTARVSLPGARYRRDPSLVAFYSRLKERLVAQPGVSGVTFANVLPIEGGGPFLSYSVEGEPAPDAGSTPDANVRVVDPDYFKLMAVPLRAGRLPSADDGEAAPHVLVVNETLARLLGHGGSPIGKRVAFDSDDAGKPNWWEVVGVVGDVKHQGLDQDEVRAVYAPVAQFAPRAVSIILRTDGRADALAAGLRSSLHEVDPTLALFSVRTYDEILRASLRTRRFAMILLGFFGVVGLALAGLGIYSVLSYTVTQRRHEIGVRMALGAGRDDVVRMVVRQGMLLAGIGLGLGAALSLGALSFASSLLYQVSPFDPLSLIAGIAVLGAISLAACLVPAARASGVDPAIALRQD